MKNILEVINKLFQSIQRSDQYIVNVMTLVKMSKQRLQKRSKCKIQKVSNLHYIQVEIFYQIVDKQQEFNNRLTIINIELLLYITCLNSSASFSAFDKKLIPLIEFYLHRIFFSTRLLALDSQRENLILSI
ncbi:hypothetical protein HN873_036212 [Arachis hypogaea]